MKFTEVAREVRRGLLWMVEKRGEVKRSWERSKERSVHKNHRRMRSEEKNEKFLVEGISDAILITEICKYKCIYYVSTIHNPSPVKPTCIKCLLTLFHRYLKRGD